MTVTNNRGGPQSFLATNQTALDRTGRTIDADTSALISMPNASQVEDAQLSPGTSITATVPFNVPASDTIKRVELHDTDSSGGVTVNLA
jgi:hypothetical protein